MRSFARHLRPCAIVAVLVAAALVIVLLAWSLELRFVIEPTDEARYAAAAGSRLGTTTWWAVAVLGVGVLIGRPSVWGRTAAAAIQLVAAGATLALAGTAFVQAHEQLHPSFDVERRAVADFAAPTGADPFVSTEVRAQRTLSATWRIAGAEGPVCRGALVEFTRWADPGSVRRTAVTGSDHDRAARRGPDAVELTCLAAPAPGSPVNIILRLTRTT